MICFLLHSVWFSDHFRGHLFLAVVSRCSLFPKLFVFYSEIEKLFICWREFILGGCGSGGVVWHPQSTTSSIVLLLSPLYSSCLLLTSIFHLLSSLSNFSCAILPSRSHSSYPPTLSSFSLLLSPRPSNHHFTLSVHPSSSETRPCLALCIYAACRWPPLFITYLATRRWRKNRGRPMENFPPALTMLLNFKTLCARLFCSTHQQSLHEPITNGSERRTHFCSVLSKWNPKETCNGLS